MDSDPVQSSSQNNFPTSMEPSELFEKREVDLVLARDATVDLSEKERFELYKRLWKDYYGPMQGPSTRNGTTQWDFDNRLCPLRAALFIEPELAKQSGRQACRDNGIPFPEDAIFPGAEASSDFCDLLDRKLEDLKFLELHNISDPIASSDLPETENAEWYCDSSTAPDLENDSPTQRWYDEYFIKTYTGGTPRTPCACSETSSPLMAPFTPLDYADPGSPSQAPEAPVASTGSSQDYRPLTPESLKDFPMKEAPTSEASGP